ncbi:MAG TPA: Wzz/FepE/Etk N-terminal domain-containing protein [Vicinamibacterales bacterium]|nr:Wzz/FepE/Etk N-terminal domain-containing protein [Vicinamibacterales bacterium]
MDDRTVHPLEYLAILRRRRRWFLVPFAACVTAGAALAWLWPETYRSSATIAVEAPAVSPDLVAARAALEPAERIRALSQQLRSPAVLERVAREEQLTLEQPVEEAVRDLRERVTVEIPRPIARAEGVPELNAFEIVYRDRTAERARRIANRLAHVFVEEHSRAREAQAEGTAEFLAAQLRASEQRIARLEQQLRAAKESNMGRLPEQTLANLQTLAGLRQQLESTSNTLRGEQDRLAFVERQIQSLRQGAGNGAAAAGPASPQARVLALQRALTEARAKYTDRHPEIQYLEHELEAARAELARGRPAAGELLEADPAFQQLAAERDMLQLRIRGLRRTEAQLASQIARYQARLESAPTVEQELAPLQREYDLEKENYRQLSARHAAAVVQEQITRRRGGERFTVLYSAYLPEAPESPRRGRILLVAVALGLALGLGAAFGREYLDWSVRDARGLQRDFAVPVLAEIPRIRRSA